MGRLLLKRRISAKRDLGGKCLGCLAGSLSVGLFEREAAICVAQLVLVHEPPRPALPDSDAEAP